MAINKDWCTRMAKMEDGQEISAGARDHPLRADWSCGARRQATAGGNDPADCNWPVCGCDPYATKVIEALQESGLLK